MANLHLLWCDLKRWSAENSQQTDCATENCVTHLKSRPGEQELLNKSVCRGAAFRRVTYDGHACCVPPSDTLTGTCAIYTWSYAGPNVFDIFTTYIEVWILPKTNSQKILKFTVETSNKIIVLLLFYDSAILYHTSDRRSSRIFSLSKYESEYNFSIKIYKISIFSIGMQIWVYVYFRNPITV